MLENLAPAYFSPNYKNFDQILQTVKYKTTVLLLVVKEFLRTSIPLLTSVLYAKGSYDSPLRNFRLTMPMNFVGNFFCVSKEFWYRKFSSKGGGKLQGFVEIFLISQDRGTTILCFRKFLVGKKFLWIRGGRYHEFPSKTFVRQYRKLSLGNTSVYQKISAIEKLYASDRAGITFSVKNFLSHSTKKFRRGNRLCFRKFGVSKNFMHKKGVSLNSDEYRSRYYKRKNKTFSICSCE